MTLVELRGQLDQIDRNILKLIADRQATVRDIAKFKQSSGSPLRDFGREREVLVGAAEHAVALGISPDVAQTVMRLLIRYSLTLQERAGVSAEGRGNGRRALVIGGAGKMGGWFAQFLDSQGFKVDISDPHAPADLPVVADWTQSRLEYEYIVVATPLGVTNEVLHQIAEVRPTGVVFDVASLKSPLRTGMSAMKTAGVQAASLHPMFGPNVELLAGRRIVFVDTGSAAALKSVYELFSSTMATKVALSVDEHDHLMAYVLGLPHAVNILFFTALQGSGESVSRLLEVAGTTFAAQFNLSRDVAQEDSSFYYDIQKLNDFNLQALGALSGALQSLLESVGCETSARFGELMQSGKDYTRERRQIGARSGKQP